jgi:hypothetical protein
MTKMRDEMAPSRVPEARDRALRDQVDATEDELSTKTITLREVQCTLVDKEVQLAWIKADLDAPRATQAPRALIALLAASGKRPKRPHCR